MKLNKEKIKQKVVFIGMNLVLALNTIQADEKTTTPGFNNEEAQKAAGNFLTPLTTFALWAIPITAAVTIGISGLFWMGKDEEEKEQKPFIKTVKKIMIVTIIVESIPTLMKIFGVA